MNEDQSLEPKKTKTSPQELERLEKGFLDGLESLRREEGELVEKFKIQVAGDIFIDHLEENFSFKENLKRFLGELSKTEEQLFNQREKFDETEVNQALSRLRILREKGQTLFDRTQQSGVNGGKCSGLDNTEEVSACKIK